MSFAVPRAPVREILSIKAHAVRVEPLGDGHVALVRGALLPVVRLGAVLQTSFETPSHLVIIDPPGGRRFALAVEGVGDHEEVVVRPTAPALGTLAVYAGQALPDNGIPTLVLDVSGIAEVGGIPATMSQPAVDVIAAPTAHADTMLTYTGLDGVRKCLRARLVDRLEDIPLSAFKTVGATTYAAIEGVLHRVHLDGPLPSTPHIAAFRINRGSAIVIHPVLALHDLHPLGALTTAEDAGGMIALIEGEPLEMFEVEPVPGSTIEQRLVA